MSLLEDELDQELAPDRVLTRMIDRIAYASDASFYRLIPRVVVQPRSLDEIGALFRLSRAHGIPMTFRTGGTSLSGQAVTQGILVDLSKHFRAVRVEDEGRRVRVEPGVIGARVNQLLAPHHRKMGPDPASINSCMMGGILANNSSGMCCGVTQNSYHTLRSVTFLLPDGTLVNTADPEADARLASAAPDVHAGIRQLRDEVRADGALVEKIRAKYRIKNTMGYSLNAFVDFEKPVDILAHLLVGSEGTLAYIAEAVLDTVPEPALKLTGWLVFPTVADATASLPALRRSGVMAAELLDRASLIAVRHLPGSPVGSGDVPAGATGMLIEYAVEDRAALAALQVEVSRLVQDFPALVPPTLTTDPTERARIWKLRKGLFPAVGAVRARGTTVIIEDVAFPEEHLAAAVEELQQLFVRHAYHEAIVFGHAKDGNLHFVITQSFGDQAAIDRYARFMEDLVDLVVKKHDGALKAEHGTGRNMAPFVETEWGPAAYSVMKRLKRLVDPAGLLNPGVIVNDDPLAHVKDTKDLPVVEEEVDRCIECGFCEPACPSRDLTTTPRRRIVLRREQARQAALGDPLGVAAAIERDFRYEVVETCATDGLCSLACPVSIDTGKLVKKLRSLSVDPTACAISLRVVDHFGLVERFARIGLGAGGLASRLMGAARLDGIAQAAARMVGAHVPHWMAEIPPPAPGQLPRTTRAGARAVYVPSCLSRMFGLREGSPYRSLPEVMEVLSRRAGHPLWIPDDVAGFCCGLPFHSKGYEDARERIVERSIGKLEAWTDGGRLPVVIDNSSCAQGLAACAEMSPSTGDRLGRLDIQDAAPFVLRELAPKLTLRPVDRKVALHPPCSAVKMDQVGAMRQLAQACARDVLVPETAGCCGFAGDRGMLHPELTESATRSEAAEIAAFDPQGQYSTNVTCEIGLTRATGRPFRSLLELVEEASR